MGRHSKEQKEIIAGVVASCNPIKSKLIDLVRELESAGLTSIAAGLDNIAGRLEHWQNVKAK